LPGNRIHPAHAVTVTMAATSVQRRGLHRRLQTLFIVTVTPHTKKINRSKTPTRHPHPQ